MTIANYYQPLRFPDHPPAAAAPTSDGAAAVACRFADLTDEEYPIAKVTFQLTGIVLNFDHGDRLSPIGIFATPATYVRISGSAHQKVAVYHSSSFTRCTLSFASSRDCDMVAKYLAGCATRVTMSVMSTCLRWQDVLSADEGGRVLLTGWVMCYATNQPPRYNRDGFAIKKFILGYADVTFPAFDLKKRLPNDMDGTVRIFADTTKERRLNHIILPRHSEDRKAPKCTVKGAILVLHGVSRTVLRLPSEAHARLWARAIDAVVVTPPLDEMLLSKEVKKETRTRFNEAKQRLVEEIANLKLSTEDNVYAGELVLMDAIEENLPSHNKENSSIDGLGGKSSSISIFGAPTAAPSTITYKPAKQEMLSDTVIIGGGGTDTVTTTASAGTVIVYEPPKIGARRESLGTVIEGSKGDWKPGDFGGHLLAQTSDDLVQNNAEGGPVL
ncbi:hypothetical protein FOL47_005025 [Perkinsus chesapeaki]|uniref:Uncharacterized protein n=1 Tax=Perkinsus chesapeaki TaxID=330153 RepID=A0A7J6LZE5_PERCH|nr:hypothetical protein FOL47_005025 [Perkinsus chesapeaki]